MAIMKSRAQPERRSPVDRMNEAADRIGGSLKGKTVVFVTDDIDKKNESVVSEFIFEKVQAGEGSRVISYNDLFSNPDQDADILILRGSRIYDGALDRITGALGDFRSHHPEAAVLVCYNVESFFRYVSPLLEAGLANVAVPTLSMEVTDYHIMEKGAKVLAKMRGD